MELVILSHARPAWAQQATAQVLEAAHLPYTLLVQASQQTAYAPLAAHMQCGGLRAMPAAITTLPATRDFVLYDMQANRAMMFDDDLQFARRRADEPAKFRPLEPGDAAHMIHGVATLLGDYPMVGIAAREGGNRNTDPIIECTRMMRAWALDCAWVRAHGFTFSPFLLMQDFHMNLQILESGSKTAVLNTYVTNQLKGSNAPGGCSTYRTPQLMELMARQLAQRHPGVVKVVSKKNWEGMDSRMDVTVQWKEAYKRGVRK